MGILAVSRVAEALGVKAPGPARAWTLLGGACWFGLALGAVADSTEAASGGLWVAAVLLGVLQAVAHVALAKAMRGAKDASPVLQTHAAGSVLAGTQPCAILLAVYTVVGAVIGATAVLARGLTSLCKVVPLLGLYFTATLAVAATLAPVAGGKRTLATVTLVSTFVVGGLGLVLCAELLCA